MQLETIKELEAKATEIRRSIIKMTGAAGSGHPGGSLSAADIVATLYFHQLKLDPAKPDWADRDRFILSKGHAAPVLYGALAERGFFPKEELLSLRKMGSRLQGHPDRNLLPGVEMSTGSLGQGFSASIGVALAGKLDKKDYGVYVLLGDGECQEGIVWEAAMAAAHYKLDNLTCFLDWNGLQIDGPTAEVMSPEPLNEKWRAFGWHVLEIDGHDIGAILAALEASKAVKDRPVMIIAKTVKGKGVSFMENQVGWHGKAPDAEQVRQALVELG
ncbi:MAG: transketolase [Bacillota bacterium]